LDFLPWTQVVFEVTCFPRCTRCAFLGGGGGGGGDAETGGSASRSGRLNSRGESRDTLSMEGLECNEMI
jgi:hypothetical protein